jgi:glycosyltransferase involved in cell wall biosynthesis
MNSPLISVIMPVYNTAPFLKEAIESILNQTEGDFELIIINDASTDNSGELINSISDSRIRVINNEKNLGLAVSLNKGIRSATGKYIARMDGDDISIVNRFEEQLKTIKTADRKTVVCSTCLLIDENGNKIGKWKDDSKYCSPTEIRKQLPNNNCIVHPSIFVRKELLAEFFYDPEQQESEDYDLWLRMASDDVQFLKTSQPLVLHRIRKHSFTRQRQHNIFFKLFRVKIVFMFHEIIKGRINLFMLKTFAFSILDIVKGLFKMLKKKLSK